MLEILRKHTFRYWVFAIGFLIVFLLSYQKLAFYVRFDFNFILFLLVLPFVIQKSSSVKSIRYGYLSLALLILYPFVNLSSVYFFACITALFFLYERQFGKLSVLPLMLVIVVSPVVVALSELLGFEIRLFLTDMAGRILQIINDDYASAGNIIIKNGKEFHVDPACMGLKMVILSFFTALILVSYYQKRTRSVFSFFSLILLMLITYLLVIISNLFRIIIITAYEIKPESIGHDIAGVLSFLVYVLLPLYFAVRYFPSKPAKAEKEHIETRKSSKQNPVFFIMITFIIGLMVFYNFRNRPEKNDSIIQPAELGIETDNYTCSQEEHDVLKLDGNNVLIYIKPAVSFYSADHSPVICWKGSGYEIQKEQVLELNTGKVYFSELSKGNDILYTTWWYESHAGKTISQFQWRSKNLFTDQNFHLVNVISHDRSILLNKTRELMNEQLFFANNNSSD
ncbi:MAG: exosortase N [Bacteroidales bacterium]|nr:exosortase N [Bacteroidales bacterium]